MYIRWVVRRHKSAASAHITFHDAYLVESQRDERGRPRQRTICYLGNLREIDGAVPHVESELFLLRAVETLHQAAAVVPLDVEATLHELRQRLPALTPEAARHAFAAQIGWFYQWWAHHGVSRPGDEVMRIVCAVIGDDCEQAREVGSGRGA
jgi:hypothetical protein